MTLHLTLAQAVPGAMRPPRPLFLRSLATRLGDQVLPVDHAVADGRYAADQARKDGYSALRQSSEPLRLMAGHVAAQALARADLPPEGLSLVTFTAIHDHGEGRLWQPAAYLMDQLGAENALGWSLGFGCNGLMLSLLQAGLLLPALGGAALVVGADRFAGTTFDRWTSDKGLAYGDAASAVVVSPTRGFAEICFLGVEYVPALEALHRGGHAVTDAQTGWDVTASKSAFIVRHGSAQFFSEISRALHRLKRALLSALTEQGISLAAVVTPFVGDSVRTGTYDAVFGPLAPVHTTAFGQSVGHTGTSDQLLGLAHLLENSALCPGDHVLLIGAGAGFSVTATVLRIDALPPLSQTGDFQ